MDHNAVALIVSELSCSIAEAEVDAHTFDCNRSGCVSLGLCGLSMFQRDIFEKDPRIKNSQIFKVGHVT